MVATVLLLTVCVYGGIALGSDSADSGPATTALKKRVRALERQVGALKRLYLLTPDSIETNRASGPMFADAGNPRWREGEAHCGSGEAATGGGVAFLGTLSADDVIPVSEPTPNGWHGISYSPSGNSSYVYAVCARLEP